MFGLIEQNVLRRVWQTSRGACCFCQMIHVRKLHPVRVLQNFERRDAFKQSTVINIRWRVKFLAGSGQTKTRVSRSFCVGFASLTLVMQQSPLCNPGRPAYLRFPLSLNACCVRDRNGLGGICDIRARFRTMEISMRDFASSRSSFICIFSARKFFEGLFQKPCFRESTFEAITDRAILTATSL